MQVFGGNAGRDGRIDLLLRQGGRGAQEERGQGEARRAKRRPAVREVPAQDVSQAGSRCGHGVGSGHGFGSVLRHGEQERVAAVAVSLDAGHAPVMVGPRGA